MTRTLAVTVSIRLLPAAMAAAAESDLSQTISDLRSQASDKEKMDALGATRVELSQIRTWLNDATNAVKEEAEERCRRVFELVRAQLKLVDELTALSKIENEAKRLAQAIAKAKHSYQSAKSQLEGKQAELRALKLKDSK